MAASNIQVTAGSGTRLATNSYTEGAVTVHDEKVIFGEPYLASYTIAPLLDISTATGNSHLIQVMAGSANRVRVRRIEIYQSVMATTAALMGLAIYRLSTAGTGGTAHTPRALDPADGASGATAMTLPSSKGTEGNLMFLGKVYMMQTLAASSELTAPLLSIDFESLRLPPLIIAAGTSNGIAVKNTDTVAGASLIITVWLTESSF